MYTQCPQCLTIFEIDEDALQASLGIVKCGQCSQRFDALRTLSNTLPIGQDAALAERDPTESVPTLTAPVPPASLEPGARERRPESAVAPTPALESEPTGLLPLLVADQTHRQPGQLLPGGNSDWFADLETELTSSLIADATRAPHRETSVANAWQVSGLPAQTRFADLDIPVTVAGSGTRADSTAVEPRSHGLPGNDSLDLANDEASDAASPTAPADAGTLPSAQAEIPFGDIDPAGLEAWDPPDGRAASPRWFDELDVDAPIPDSLLPAEFAPDIVDPASTEPGAGFATSPASQPDDAGVAADVTAGPTSAHVRVVFSDPAAPLAPVYVRPRRRRAAGVAWALGCLVLVLVLAAQIAWVKRVELVRNPATHAWVAHICQMIACRLPPIRDVAKLELLARDVRPDPRTPGALMITATVRNDATFRQPWPVMVVDLTDLDNNPVAMRRFGPAEYLPDAARRAAGIAPGATAAIALEVADPGKRAVAFQFSFE